MTQQPYNNTEITNINKKQDKVTEEFCNDNVWGMLLISLKTSCIPLQHFQFVPNCITVYNVFMF